MFNEAAFRIAFIISFSLHFVALSSGFLFQHKPFEKKKPEIEITYIIQEASKYRVPEKFLEKLPAKYDLKKEEPKKASRDKPPGEDEGIKRAEVSEKKDDYIEEKDLEKLEDYIQYYELIREKIKQNVTENYASSAKEGRVEVVFTIYRLGGIKNITVDEGNSVNDLYLKKIALQSVKDAAPFPAFPRSLNRSELTFSIAIIFRRE